MACTLFYTLSLHDALPIYPPANAQDQRAVPLQHRGEGRLVVPRGEALQQIGVGIVGLRDRKSTRLNSSHLGISYAVFCLKKKKNNHLTPCQKRHHQTLRTP